MDKRLCRFLQISKYTLKPVSDESMRFTRRRKSELYRKVVYRRLLLLSGLFAFIGNKDERRTMSGSVVRRFVCFGKSDAAKGPLGPPYELL